jgi:protein TonB
MDYAYRPQNTGYRYRGLAVVAAVHGLLGWVLVSGTARQGLEILKRPLEAVVIQEVFIPPPPPPPPPPKEIKPPEVKPPKVEAPAPPPFVPPPEVRAATPAPAAPAITATPAPPAASPAIATPVPLAPAAPVIATPAPVSPPAPAPAPPVARTGPRQEFGVVCPTQVEPTYPREARKAGTEGVVLVELMVKDGAIAEKDIKFLSGPRIFYSAVRAALLQYKCTGESAEVVRQEFKFRID